MMDGGIRSAGLGRKQATARSNDTLQSQQGQSLVRAEHPSRVSCIWAEYRASGQMAGTGGKAAAPPGRWASTPPPSPNS